MELKDKQYSVWENKLFRSLFFIILCIGLFLRFYQHFMGRSLWEDECHFALNFIKYGYLRLAQPLDDIQAGPILFLWGVKTLTLIFGYTEVAFRSFTWLSCILTLPLFYYVAWELTKSKIAALFAFLLFSINISLIYFSSELKPYGIDVSVYIFLVYLVLSKNAYVARYRYRLLMVGGVLSILLSNIAFIILFCIGIYMLAGWWKSTQVNKSELKVSIVWLVVFLANYFLFINNHPATADQRLNYSFAFSPVNIFSHDFYVFFKARSVEIFYTMLLYAWNKWFFTWAIIFLLSIAIVFASVTGRFRFILFTCVPVFLHWLLSAMHLYPFWYRLILYLVPAIIIILSYGVAVIFGFLQKKVHLVGGIVFLAYCLIFFTKKNIEKFPLWPLEIKPALGFVNANATPSTHVYVSTPINAYKYYKYRGYVKDSAYKAVPWTFTPFEFYDLVGAEKSDFVFFYGSSYHEFGYADIVKDLHDKHLIKKEFEYGGYIAAIVRPVNSVSYADSFYRVIDAAKFGEPLEYIEHLWRGQKTSDTIMLPAGLYRLLFVAKGTPALGQYPHCSVRVNDTLVGSITPKDIPARLAPIGFTLPKAGPVKISVSLDNDTIINNEDRNVFITRILIDKLK